jgi:hypothetical protein
MPNCKYCGKWSGLFEDEHMDCALAASQGKTAAEIREDAGGAPVEAFQPVTPTSIFWAVLGALWAFALSAGLLVAVLRALFR